VEVIISHVWYVGLISIKFHLESVYLDQWGQNALLRPGAQFSTVSLDIASHFFVLNCMAASVASSSSQQVDSESFIFHVTLFFLATLGFIVLFRLPRGIALTSGALDTYSVVFHTDPLGQPLVLDASFELHIQHVVWLLSHPPQHPRDLHMMLLLMSHIRLRIINKRSSESTPWDVQ